MKVETPTRARSVATPRIYLNVMESLVEREVERQFRHLSPHLARCLDPIDVATYALNRLPPLYASTEKGKIHQELAGEGKLKSNIETAVRQAIAAVQRDPLRQMTPLKAGRDRASERKAFFELQEWLHARHLLGLDPVSADNLVSVVRSALRAVLKPHLVAMARLQILLVKKYRVPLDGDITYGNLVKVVDRALAARSDSAGAPLPSGDDRL